MPAWAPVSEMAGVPIAWRAIETSVALWCSPVARRTSSSRESGSSVMRRGQLEQLVGRVAHRGHDDDQLRPGGTLAGDPPRHPADPVGIGERGAAELLDDERRRHRLSLAAGSSGPPAEVSWD